MRAKLSRPGSLLYNSQLYNVKVKTYLFSFFFNFLVFLTASIIKVNNIKLLSF